MNTNFNRRILHRAMIEPGLTDMQYPVNASSRSRLFASISTVEYYISTWISPKLESDDKALTESLEASSSPPVPK